MALFLPDPGGIADLLQDQATTDGLSEIAEDIAARAREIAPEDEGDYREGIIVENGVDTEGAYGRVHATWFTSWWIEAGTEDTPTFAPLRKACDAVGLSLTPRTGA